jgi:hypothetical protein
MHRRWSPLAVWAAMLGVATALIFVFSTNPYYWGLLGGAAVLTAGLAGYYLSRPVAPPGHVPDLSYATVAVAAGASIAVVGVPFGTWLWLPGLGLLAAGLGGLVREVRLERSGA